MTSHLGILMLFGLFVSTVFSVLMRDEPAQQFRFGARLLGSFVGVAIVLSWVLYFLPL